MLYVPTVGVRISPRRSVALLHSCGDFDSSVSSLMFGQKAVQLFIRASEHAASVGVRRIIFVRITGVIRPRAAHRAQHLSLVRQCRVSLGDVAGSGDLSCAI